MHALVYLDMLMNLKAKNSFVYIGFYEMCKWMQIDGLFPPLCIVFRTEQCVSISRL